MNRAIAAALATVCLPMAFLADPTGGSWAQVPEEAAAKQQRIEKYQDRRLIFEGPSAAPSAAAEAATPNPFEYSLRQGPDPIYDRDFVELLNDASLTRFFYQERNKDYAYWLGTGLIGVPAGTLLFYQNFIGQGATAIFAKPLPPEPSAQPAVTISNASDWRSFALTVVGVGLAGYGLYNLSLWLLEELDWRHPNRLDRDSIVPRVESFNEELRNRLALDPEDIPAPPTPRPSVSPSTSPVPSGFLPPSPPVGGPDALPFITPPSAVPHPLPLQTPGGPPSALVPSPRTSLPADFNFPGTSPRPAATRTP